MRKTVVTLLSVIALFAMNNMNAQEFPGMDPSPMDVAYFPDKLPYADLRARSTTAPKIKIYYSRPQVKGREIFGAKEKYGKMWRMGANEANEITFYSDVTIGTTKVGAGTYTIFAIPEKTKWTFVLHSKLNTWGNYALQDSKEVARVEGPVSKSDDTIEALSIYFKEVDGGAHMVVGWENTIAEMPIKM